MFAAQPKDFYRSFCCAAVNISVVPRQNKDIRESENEQPWKNWNCQNHSQNRQIAIFVHEIGNFPKNRKINETISIRTNL